MKYDAIIIGAGVVGASIARELSRYALSIAVLEKASDVCEGTSKANSGIVHAGFDAMPGTKKAYFNVLGSKKMEALSKELDFAYRKNGAYVLSFEEEGLRKLEELRQRGIENGVEGLEILTGDEARSREGALSEEVKYALYAPTSGVVCPFELTIAMAENAAVNGASFFLNTEVTNIRKTDCGFAVETTKGSLEASVVVNAAGVYADCLHNMLCEDKIQITARKGEYQLFDKKVGNTVQSTIFQLPGVYGKGVLVTPTVHGNLLVGPTAADTQDKEEVCTTREGLAAVGSIGARSIKALPGKMVITSFAGLRAVPQGGDFLIGMTSVSGFFEAAGMESPGLSAAPAVGEYLAREIADYLQVPLKDTFLAKRKGIFHMAGASNEERQQKIAENPAYANVICRCELVTEGEILDAIHRPLGATTLDAVKRRTRAGMGRCQAGFCTPKSVEILARELGCKLSDITKHGAGSELVCEHKSL